MPDPIPSPAIAAALLAWEEHGQAGETAEECMRAALEVALFGWDVREELGIRHFEGEPSPIYIRPVPRLYSPHITVWRRMVGQTAWVHAPEEETRRG